MQMQHFHFSRFHLQDKRRTSVPLWMCARLVGARVSVRQCAFMRECVYLFVKFEMRGDRWETGGEVI